MSSQAAQFRHARPALLENGIEDEKASAGDHAATLGHKARSVDVTVHEKHKHLITDKVSQSVLVPVDRRASQPRSRLSRSTISRPWSQTHGRAVNDLDGEFDPGSGRTLAACLTHASRAGSIQWQHWGRPSGERVSNT